MNLAGQKSQYIFSTYMFFLYNFSSSRAVFSQFLFSYFTFLLIFPQGHEGKGTMCLKK